MYILHIMYSLDFIYNVTILKTVQFAYCLPCLSARSENATECDIL